MTAKISTSPEGQVGVLLKSAERAVCIRISTGEAPFSQQAVALLAVDEGESQAGAGQQADLTRGQVNYLVSKFRNNRMAIFPESLLDASQPESEPSPIPVPEAKKPKQKPKKEKKKKTKKARQSEKSSKTRSAKDKGSQKTKKKGKK